MVPLFLDERVVLAPRPGGLAEGGAGALLRRSAGVSGNDIAAGLYLAFAPRVNVAATAAADDLALVHELSVPLQVNG
jgi:hypothetical protein